MAEETTRTTISNGTIVKSPATTSATATGDTANGGRATGDPANGASTIRTSKRLNGGAAEAIVIPEGSRLLKELETDLIPDFEATRERRAKAKVESSGRKWDTIIEDVHPNDKKIDVEGAKDTQHDAGKAVSGGGNEVKKRKAASQIVHDSTVPPRPTKATRRGGVSGEKKGKNSTPAGETAGNEGGEGTAPPEDDDPGEGPSNIAQVPHQLPPRNADEKFLRDCIAEYQTANPRKNSTRRTHIDNVLPLLRRVRQPSDDRTQRFANIPPEEDPSRPDCYLLDAGEARRLLESTVEVNAPVLVPNGARDDLFGSMATPVEQVLRIWLLDEKEKSQVTQSGRKDDEDDKGDVSLPQLRAHFLTPSADSRVHPWNLPDINNPRLEQCKPHFVQSLNCNLVRDVLRRSLDPLAHEVCPEICKYAYKDRLGCSKKAHKLTHREHHKLREESDLWLGTMMLADPGAITTSHVDAFGMGTWISCHQGLIGLVWRSHPTDAELRTHISDPTGAKSVLMGTSIYKVLRPGEAVYMPPGTIHTVFRKPSGNPTLAFAGHMLRRSAMAQWLHTFNEQALRRADTWDQNGTAHEHIVPVLVRAARDVLGHEDQADLFGGIENWNRANRLLRTVNQTGRRLQTIAFKDPVISRETSPVTEEFAPTKGKARHEPGAAEGSVEEDQPDKEGRPEDEGEEIIIERVAGEEVTEVAEPAAGSKKAGKRPLRPIASTSTAATKKRGKGAEK
ncbi:hypothetical protein PRZ48_003121 [Zasmidium cellare]|uniref:JmjC domain-containing protein n=1 Tax=Zasmidium cellare TaxID=395010 RepID=A0ABR0EVG6_ZASCE|nr:hypothetical protein PRZ48_003121 [Zasmidium cellare]